MDTAIMQEILDILHKNNIAPQNLYNVLNDTLEYANNIYWETCMVSIPMLYTLKDTVWFNLEHLKSGGNDSGIITLGKLGSRFPKFAELAVSDVYMSQEDVKILVNELNHIALEWSPSFYLIKLDINSRETLFTNAKNIDVLIQQTNNSNQNNRYNYNSRSTVLDVLGYKQSNKDVLLCIKDGIIGDFETNSLLYNTLNNLQLAVQRAVELNKGLMLDISSYETNKY